MGTRKTGGDSWGASCLECIFVLTERINSNRLDGRPPYRNNGRHRRQHIPDGFITNPLAGFVSVRMPGRRLVEEVDLADTLHLSLSFPRSVVVMNIN